MTDTGSRNESLLDIEYKDIPARKLTEKVCRRYGYGFATAKGTSLSGQRVHAADYHRKGKIVSQHLRSKDKKFAWLSSNPGIELFGQHLWESGGKQLIITEGEIDCLSWAVVRDLKWPVVAVPGTSSMKMIALHRQWICSFDEVVLYFDMDDQGQAFAREVAAFLSPTTVRIGNTAPYKDSNEMFIEVGQAALFKTLYQAKTWRPDTIQSHEDALESTEETRDILLGVEAFDRLTGGLSWGELVMVGAGSNIGKSMLLRQLAYSCANQGLCVGYFPLEEGVVKVAKGIQEIGNVPVGSITYYRDAGLDLLEDIPTNIEYLATAEDVRVFFIDHVTSIFNQSRADVGGIDGFLQGLQALALRLDILIVYNSHVKDPVRGSYETGQLPTADSFRGSGMLYRIPDVVMVLGRAITDSDSKHLTTLMCLKHRSEGMRVGDYVVYKLVDGRITATDEDVYFDDDDEEGGDF